MILYPTYEDSSLINFTKCIQSTYSTYISTKFRFSQKAERDTILNVTECRLKLTIFKANADKIKQTIVHTKKSNRS